VEPFTQLCAESTRTCNAQLAGVRPRAGRDIGDRRCTGDHKLEPVEFVVERRKILLMNPAKEEVLIHRRPESIRSVLPHEVGQLP
jgi:hypothetical protein